MKRTNLYVLTGFLGAGKTTVLLKLLDELQDNKIGVIQNEFGKLSIDSEILSGKNIEMKEINKGSIFCSCLQLSFLEALEEMAAKDFEYLFIESSGLGDPSNVEEILNVIRKKAGDIYDFKGCICFVDACNFLDQLEDLETVYRQLKHCHLAVITKTDLVDEKKIEELMVKIREINPKCKIELSALGSLNLDFLQEDLMKYKWAEGEETTNSEETKPKTLFMNIDGEVEKDKLNVFLEDIKPDVYRIKGFFNIKGEGYNQVDVVGKRIDYKPCENKEISHVIFISKIGPAIIKRIFDSWKENVGIEMQLKN